MTSSQESFTELSVDFNIDGVPISKSSNSSFWLILAQIFGPDAYRKIYVVGVYHGFNKPKSFYDFLQPLINELHFLENYSFNIISVKVNIRCIIADAPARNSCLGNKAYNGYFGCGRCMQEGVYTIYRMTFPDIAFTKRTDENFRNKTQPDHATIMIPHF